MNTKRLILIVAILGIFQGCQIDGAISDDTAEKKASLQSFDYPASPEGVVAAFSEHFFLSVSPEQGKESSRFAYNMLSSDARARLGQVKAGLTNRMVIFSGVPRVPNHGYQILGVIERTEEKALVEAYWTYSNDTLENINSVKTFALVRENTGWKISMIN